jgi:hypothetical protein
MQGLKQGFSKNVRKWMTKEVGYFNQFRAVFDELILFSAHKKWRKTQSRFLSLRRWLTRTIPARHGR